ncbi:MAG: hypothetical protein JXB14_02730 [Candidatus Altiarchaeota archaeon]|nr:hypothetical protein [Candidatus Altiarchaeota archaeon]
MDFKVVAVLIAVVGVAAAFVLLNLQMDGANDPTSSADNGMIAEKTSPGEDIPIERDITVRENPRYTPPPEVEGNCTLLYSKTDKRYGCFGCAGGICETPDGRWAETDSDKYFCRATEYGCKVYQKVELNI